MRELAYSVLDVFAERALEGNPLAVFHDGRGLSDNEMQALARETNLSETVFVLPSEDPGQDRREGVRVRIFTTEEELPFAGHPTLGTATWLHLHHPPVQGAETVVLRCHVGPIPVRFTPGANVGGGAGLYGEMRQHDPVFGAEFDPAEIAALIGVPAGDLLPGYRPQSVSTGNAFCIVALRSVEALGRLAIPQRQASAWLRERSIRWFYCIAPETASGDPAAPPEDSCRLAGAHAVVERRGSRHRLSRGTVHRLAGAGWAGRFGGACGPAAGSGDPSSQPHHGAGCQLWGTDH